MRWNWLVEDAPDDDCYRYSNGAAVVALTAAALSGALFVLVIAILILF